MPLPKIVIIGRPNVGKSSLLNRLASRRICIVDPTAGVTRDRISTTIEIPAKKAGKDPHHATVIDTGGYGIKDSMDLTTEVEQQIANGLAEADLVLFLVDAQSGIVTLDETVGMALLVVLDQMTPAERTAFVLHDVFDVPFDEIGQIAPDRLCTDVGGERLIIAVGDASVLVNMRDGRRLPLI